MANPYRKMCAELLEWAERTSSHYYKQADVIVRARALLDQPEPKGPKPMVDYSRVPEIATEAQIRSAAQYLVKKQNCDGDLIPAIKYAIARWGRPTPQPPADGEVGELVEWLSDQVAVYEIAFQSASGATRLRRVAALLSQRHPAPVPVSERLPGAEDCTAQGWCWVFYRGFATWTLEPPLCQDGKHTGYTHWLPANALPIPEATND